MLYACCILTYIIKLLHTLPYALLQHSTYSDRLKFIIIMLHVHVTFGCIAACTFCAFVGCPLSLCTVAFDMTIVRSLSFICD